MPIVKEKQNTRISSHRSIMMIEGSVLSYSDAMRIIDTVRNKITYREPELTEIVEAAFKEGVRFAEEECVNASLYKNITELGETAIRKLKEEYLSANPSEKDVSYEKLCQAFKDVTFVERDRYTVMII